MPLPPLIPRHFFSKIEGKSDVLLTTGFNKHLGAKTTMLHIIIVNKLCIINFEKNL
jgi:hypothetical protein